MDKREKVILGLECCANDHCYECPYDMNLECPGFEPTPKTLLNDALALLKAQEPVEYVVHCKNADLSNGIEFACGECDGSLLHKRVNYCPWCGKAVKWDG